VYTTFTSVYACPSFVLLISSVICCGFDKKDAVILRCVKVGRLVLENQRENLVDS